MVVVSPIPQDVYAPSPGHMLFIPAGLLMLFFGGFLIKPALCVVSCVLVTQIVYTLAFAAELGQLMTLSLITVFVVFTLLLVLEACDQGPDFATGVVLGSCIALTFRPAPLLSIIASVIILSLCFGLIFSLASKEVAIFFTSYGGGYMIFYGMELIDNDAFNGIHIAPALVSIHNISMWFSVLSFLVVGLLGCCVQLILVTGQTHTSYSRSHYIEIL